MAKKSLWLNNTPQLSEDVSNLKGTNETYPSNKYTFRGEPGKGAESSNYQVQNRKSNKKINLFEKAIYCFVQNKNILTIGEHYKAV